THKELVHALVRLCILQEPSSRTLAPSDQFPTLTLDVLERYAHMILEDSNEARGKPWVGFFERIIAEYEALRTNLLIGDGREAATLGDIYPGALGRAETLVRTVKLKELSVVTAAHRFLESGGLTIVKQDQDCDWRLGVVIKNADGAQFGRMRLS
ncbi:hypothetical protein BGZ50_001366, partial [Haplosporangium sp. Z 11]